MDNEQIKRNGRGKDHLKRKSPTLSEEEREIRRKRMIELRKKLDKVNKKNDTTMEKIAKKPEPKKRFKREPQKLEEIEEEGVSPPHDDRGLKGSPFEEEETENVIEDDVDDDEELEELQQKVNHLKNEKKTIKNKKQVAILSEEEENDSDNDDLEQKPIKKTTKKKPNYNQKPVVRKVFKIKYYDKPTPEELLQDRLFLENQHKDDNETKIKKHITKNNTHKTDDDLSNKLFNY